MTAVANPRQIERTIRGSKFPLSIIYDAEKEDEIEEDIALLAEGLKLLQYDYIGGMVPEAMARLYSVIWRCGRLWEKLTGKCWKSVRNN